MHKRPTASPGSSLTAQQPHNNVVRTTIQALAAVLGGTQSLHTNSFDEALCLPTEESALLALRTQQIIAHESGVADSVDPLGGSYLIENWTNSIERDVQALMQRVDEMGGMLSAIESGFPQGEIQRSAYEYQRKLEDGEELLIGVNKYRVEETASSPIQRMDPQGEEEQRQRLSMLRESRSAKACSQALASLKQAADGSESLMPLILDAVRADATLGEISDALREVFGEYRERVYL